MSTVTIPQVWNEATFPDINRYFAARPPQELLQSARETFGEGVVLATGFGLSGIVLMHMVSQLQPGIPVFYLQTDLLFAETLALRDKLTAQLGINFVEVHCGLSLAEQSRQYGEALWERTPDKCCHLRKVVPLRRYLADKQAWITGIRRDQSPTRANIPLVGWDAANQLVKLNPLAGWTRQQVWQYIFAHHLPYNILHDRGYPSIGCEPCTQPAAGDDERAGRWAGREKTECGIHLANYALTGTANALPEPTARL